METTAKTETKQESELDILHPERILNLAGERVEVREFGFLEGMRAEPLALPILRDITEVVRGKDGDLGLADVAGVFARHQAAFLELLSMATGREPKWLEDLNDADGHALMVQFWTLNAGFFTRRLMEVVLADRLRQRRPSAGAQPMPH